MRLSILLVSALCASFASISTCHTEDLRSTSPSPSPGADGDGRRPDEQREPQPPEPSEEVVRSPSGAGKETPDPEALELEARQFAAHLLEVLKVLRSYARSTQKAYRPVLEQVHILQKTLKKIIYLLSEAKVKYPNLWNEPTEEKLNEVKSWLATTNATLERMRHNAD